jgi:ABC-type multidrug transport system fused ATPase/permease subunit
LAAGFRLSRSVTFRFIFLFVSERFMERDPLGFVWRTTRALHLIAAALLLFALPLGWIGLDLLRVAVDDAIGGAAFEDAATAPFLRLQIDVPERISEDPLVLFHGVPLDQGSFVLATVAALVGLALITALLAWLMRILVSSVGAHAIRRLRGAVLEGIVTAPPSAREEARQAAALAGERLAGSPHAFLGGAVITPMTVIGVIGLALLYVITIDWRLTIAAAAVLVALVVAWPRRLQALDQAALARRADGAGLQRMLADLVRRLPALRAHGTASLERNRLTAEFFNRRRPIQDAERRAGFAAALATLALLLAPTVVLGVGAWLALDNRITAGEVVAATAATGLASIGIMRLVAWERDLEAARPLFDEIARTLGALQSRGRQEGRAPLPGSGALVAQGLSAYEPSSGARMPTLDASIAFPAHVALTGDPAAGSRLFAALVGGQIAPSTGRLTFGGVDLSEVDPGERAQRIAYAGGETILVAGSLRQNLLYGSPVAEGPEAEQRLIEAATVVGLDQAIHARGLLGAVSPVRDPKLAAAIVETRRAVRTALAARGGEAFVEPFDPARYNRNATVGENILFGVPLGDTFREANLPSHPFVRAILEAEGLTKTLTAMGLSIAASMVEIFADVPNGHLLFDRFSFFSAGERGYFEDLIQRQNERRRSTASGRDQERLISLALRYIESRHRLGLLDSEIEARLVKARAAFGNLLPASLKPAIEFYDPNALCAAASVMDNLLFGRVAQDRAGAEEEVRQLIRRVLTDRGLDHEVFRIGLDTHVNGRGDLATTEIAAVDVARCLVRKPDVVIVEHALEGLTTSEAEGFVARLRRALVGRGLIVVLPELTPGMDAPPFDVTLRFERSGVAVDNRRRAVTPAPMPA